METINVINVGGVDKEIEDTVARASGESADSRLDTLEPKVTQEISDRTNADTLINARIDQIVAPTGEAPNPAEITDARIGADGVTYPNLGNAIRTQILNSVKANITVTGLNRATLLPDCNSALPNTAYILNFGASETKPEHLPISGGISMALLITVGLNQGYENQYYIDDRYIFRRFRYRSTIDNWKLIFDRNVLNNKVTANLTISSSNYAELLPDCDNALANTIYILNFGASQTKPLHLPPISGGISMAWLMTFGNTEMYQSQYYMDAQYIYRRLIYAGVGYEWELVEDRQESDIIDVTPSTFFSTLKEVNGKGKTLRLAAGTYDADQMYKDYYGNDFWDNYTGREGVSDRFYHGIWLNHTNIDGMGGATFVFNNNHNDYVKNEWSMFAVYDDVTIKNLTIELGDRKMQYGIHDDYGGHNTIKFKNIIFNGVPHNGSVIGAGLPSAASSVHVIDSCVFTGEGHLYDISYHGGGEQVASSTVIVKNSYGKTGVGFRWYGTGDAVNTCIVSNSKFPVIESVPHSVAPHDINNMNLIEYMNDKSGNS